MTQQTLHIACAIDDSFMTPLMGTLVSLFEVSKDDKIKIHLFSANLSDHNALIVKDLTTNYNQDFQFYRLDLEIFKGFPVDERISYAAYYRLVMPEIIEEDVKRYLYLDADILIKRSLSELWDIDMKNYIIGAVHDPVSVRDKYYVNHSISDDYLYFNSGVLLVDKKNWINNDTTKKVQDYITTNKKLCLFHDQDGLNGVLHSKRLNLSPEWNQQIGIFFLYSDFHESIYGKENYLNAVSNPAIVHFNGMEKPWHYLCGHPDTKEFRKCVRKAGFNIKYKDKNPKNILKMLRYNVVGWQKYNTKLFNQ